MRLVIAGFFGLAIIGTLLTLALAPGERASASAPAPYTFTVDIALWGGLELTLRAPTAEACESARKATRKKLLHEAAGVIGYRLDEQCVAIAPPSSTR